MSSFIEKAKPYFRMLTIWKIDDILRENIHGILMFVILSLAAINFGIFFVVYKYFYLANIEISGWYLFFFILSLCVEMLGGGIIMRQKKERKEESSTQTLPLRENVPGGFLDVFSQIVDPIGELHVWRMKNNYLLIEDEESIVDLKLPTFEQISVSNGIRQVIYLEDFLSRHCNVELVGRYGETANYDPELHVLDSSSEKSVFITKDEVVSIVSPGWRWFDIVIRYPRVK